MALRLTLAHQSNESIKAAEGGQAAGWKGKEGVYEPGVVGCCGHGGKIIFTLRGVYSGTRQLSIVRFNLVATRREGGENKQLYTYVHNPSI